MTSMLRYFWRRAISRTAKKNYTHKGDSEDDVDIGIGCGYSASESQPLPPLEHSDSNIPPSLDTVITMSMSYDSLSKSPSKSCSEKSIPLSNATAEKNPSTPLQTTAATTVADETLYMTPISFFANGQPTHDNVATVFNEDSHSIAAITVVKRDPGSFNRAMPTLSQNNAGSTTSALTETGVKMDKFTPSSPSSIPMRSETKPNEHAPTPDGLRARTSVDTVRARLGLLPRPNSGAVNETRGYDLPAASEAPVRILEQESFKSLKSQGVLGYKARGIVPLKECSDEISALSFTPVMARESGKSMYNSTLQESPYDGDSPFKNLTVGQDLDTRLPLDNTPPQLVRGAVLTAVGAVVAAQRHKRHESNLNGGRKLRSHSQDEGMTEYPLMKLGNAITSVGGLVAKTETDWGGTEHFLRPRTFMPASAAGDDFEEDSIVDSNGLIFGEGSGLISRRRHDTLAQDERPCGRLGMLPPRPSRFGMKKRGRNRQQSLEESNNKPQYHRTTGSVNANDDAKFYLPLLDTPEKNQRGSIVSSVSSDSLSSSSSSSHSSTFSEDQERYQDLNEIEGSPFSMSVWKHYERYYHEDTSHSLDSEAHIGEAYVNNGQTYDYGGKEHLGHRSYLMQHRPMLELHSDAIGHAPDVNPNDMSVSSRQGLFIPNTPRGSNDKTSYDFDRIDGNVGNFMKEEFIGSHQLFEREGYDIFYDDDIDRKYQGFDQPRGIGRREHHYDESSLSDVSAVSSYGNVSALSRIDHSASQSFYAAERTKYPVRDNGSRFALNDELPIHKHLKHHVFDERLLTRKRNSQIESKEQLILSIIQALQGNPSLVSAVERGEVIAGAESYVDGLSASNDVPKILFAGFCFQESTYLIEKLELLGKEVSSTRFMDKQQEVNLSLKSFLSLDESDGYHWKDMRNALLFMVKVLKTTRNNARMLSEPSKSSQRVTTSGLQSDPVRWEVTDWMWNALRMSDNDGSEFCKSV